MRDRLAVRINPYLKDQCFQNALALWSIAYKSKPSPELKNKLAMIRELMGHPATECAIKPGYCGSLKELADRWAEDGENIDYADISCFGTGTSGNGGDIGCLPVLFALALIVCLILQFAGVVDVMGILESKLGATGAKAAAGILWFICLWLLIRAGRSRKRG